MKNKAMHRVHVFFSGWVQGVGFRWTAKSFADNMLIAGRIRNLPDGRVEMVAEAADKKELNELIESLEDRFSCRADEKFFEPSEGLAGFDILSRLGSL